MKEAIIVRASTLEDVLYLKDHLRFEHVAEVWASDHHTPEQALGLSYLLSKESFTLTVNGTPIFMFGVVDGKDNEGIVWALGSTLVDSYKKEFLRKSITCVAKLIRHFPLNYNYVDARYRSGVKWLEFLGAKVYEAKPHGREKLPFHYIEFRRR